MACPGHCDDISRNQPSNTSPPLACLYCYVLLFKPLMEGCVNGAIAGWEEKTRTHWLELKKKLSFPNRAKTYHTANDIHVNRIIFSLFVTQQSSDILLRGTLEKYDSHFMNFVLGAFLDRNTDRLDLDAVLTGYRHCEWPGGNSCRNKRASKERLVCRDIPKQRQMSPTFRRARSYPSLTDPTTKTQIHTDTNRHPLTICTSKHGSPTHALN